MAQIEVMSKAEIRRQMERFQADSTSPFSWAMLGELTGYGPNYLREVFLYEIETFSETMQIRMSKALQQIRNGDVSVMRRKDRSRYIHHHNTPQPRAKKGYSIQFDGQNFSVKTGVENRYDYSKPTLLEQLED